MADNNKFDWTPLGAGWTGGQYSVLRALLGAYLLAHFLHLTLWAWGLLASADLLLDPRQGFLLPVLSDIFAVDDASGIVMAVTIAGAACSLLFILGIADKPAAILMLFALACMYAVDPFIARQSTTYLGWMLLAHLLMPKAPYGSLDARGRADPGGGWRLPSPVYVVSLLILGFSYLYSAQLVAFGPDSVAHEYFGPVLLDAFSIERLSGDSMPWLPPGAVTALEVAAICVGHLFAVLALLINRGRLWFWGAIFLAQFCIAFVLEFSGTAITMLLFHLFVFNPGWIRSRKLSETATLFYDGTCASCHRLVRFVLAEDSAGRVTLSPIQSSHFRATLTREERAGLPDSIVLTSDDGMLLEADAAIRVMKMLGGLWLLAALLASVFPAPWRNAAYQYVASRRYRWFGRTETACPIVPPHLRPRFRE